VRCVFDWSYTQLPADRARLFRRLGLHPGVEFGVHAAAAVAEVDVTTAYRQLETLADVHLIESVGGRRYRFHDLLHAYAAHRAELDDDPDRRREAAARLFTWYARTARAADKLLFPGLDSVDVEPAPTGIEVPLADRARALAWLNTEQANLLAVLRAATEQRAVDAALVLAGAARFLSLREPALWPVRLESETLGLSAARTSRNRAAEALLLGFRGDTFALLDRLADAEADFGEQLVLARELDDPIRQRVALVGLGQVRLLQQRYAEARDYYRQALPLARQAGGRPEAVVECNLSRISVRLGEFGQALEHAERELVLRRQAADRVGEAYALGDVAVAHQGLGAHDTALECAEEAIALYRTLAGTGSLLAVTLETAADSLEHLGDFARAAEYLAESGTILEELDDPRAEALRRRVSELNSRAAERQPSSPQVGQSRRGSSGPSA
jgi:tetratricopeptide (TPR) repeat protein